MAKRKRVSVYIDSFNLYYGVLNGNGKGLKWLNLGAWFADLLPDADITIKFYSAAVTGKRDKDKPHRQRTYWQALRSLPNVEIIEGNFLEKPQRITITPEVYVCGRTFEEKGTDVNLAIDLVHDGHGDQFDQAVVVSNDSDLAGAVRIVSKDLKKDVWVLYPTKKVTKQLQKHADNVRQVRPGALREFQFPPVIKSGETEIRKPKSW